ncbi:hypothetical protein BOX15_Mlig034197g1 [Macrostomum lignano]|uniref:Cadherin domain-containing protein n=1 Tax=Macrostomum lignano TaxID=282301 RepID=A0A267E2N9_9PLAT|nr:hypothetical protein BOX15_Mlig034197g1 [Macrostomum lignano]
MIQQILKQPGTVLAIIWLSLVQPGFGNLPPAVSRCENLNSTYVTLPGGEDCSGSSYIIYFKEEIPSGVPLMRIVAADADGDSVSMQLVGADQATYFFRLTSDSASRTAVLYSSGRLDAESYNKISMELQITLNDGNLNIISKLFNPVIITDINDNKPEFLLQPYRWEIPENTLSVAPFKVQAIDRDRDAGSIQLNFKEVSGINIDGLFSFTGPNCRASCERNVSLLKALDYETNKFYQIAVNATDTSAGGSSVFSDIIINVLDQQDTPPFFQKVPYIARIPENSPKDTLVVTVQALDGDRGVPNPVEYYLDSANAFSKYFSLDKSTGQLTVGSTPLDRESAELLAVYGTIDLPVIAKEVSTVSQPENISQTRTSVAIIVEDQNDRTPTFNQATFNASVVENTQVGVPISFADRVVVQDFDAGVNALFNITVWKDGRTYADFEVAPATGSVEATLIVRVKNSTLLDYETVKSVNFLMIARETQTTELRSSTATVALQIIDANDNWPIFDKTKYVFSILENSVQGVVVGRVTATDLDSGAFGAISYSLDGTDNNIFSINSDTGEVTVNVDPATTPATTPLDRERISVIYLAARARDGGGFVSTVQLEVHLTDVNDNAPVFTRPSYSGLVKENSLTFESSLQVEAVDNDEKGSNNTLVQYAIVDGNYGSSFAVNQSTGSLSLVKPLDYETLTHPTIVLRVAAYDAGVPVLSNFVTVTVGVIDQNDNAPSCIKDVFSATVAETAPEGTFVAQINATDADPSVSENSKVFYRIQSGAADKFTIFGDTGIVQVERGADLDVNRFGDRYNLTIGVYDQGYPQLSGSCLLVVSVRDVNNQRPYFEVLSRRETVQENLPLGLSLPISPPYTAKDPDSSANLSYRILYDQMSALQPSGQPVQPAAYNYTSLFTVVPTTGAITVVGNLDREQAGEITIPIFVQDLANETVQPIQTATGTLILTLSDVNDEWPVFQPPAVNGTFRISIYEGTVEISTKLLATDADSSTTKLQYSTLPTNDPYFGIDPNTAQLSLKTPLDREAMSRYTLLVLVTDSLHKTTGTVEITVLDINDVQPTFYQFSDTLSVPENISVGSLLTTIKAYDNDTGAFGTVNYRILSGGGGKFSLNSETGELHLTAPLDRDVTGGDVYNLVIEAFDNPGSTNSLKSSRSMVISILDVNDNAPRFSQANFTITTLTESATAGQLIREISATDADVGVNQEIDFSLQPVPGQSDRAMSLFTVTTKQTGDSYSASLTTSTDLKGAVGWFYLILLATDKGDPRQTGSTHLTISVSDVNDHAPEFIYPNVSEIHVRINESTNASSTIGKELLQAVATDKDYGVNAVVRFSLTSSTTDQTAFRIDPVSGLLTVAINLRRTLQIQYRFQIQATDQGASPLSSQTSVVVEVWAVDESPPAFPQQSREQTFTLMENLPPAATIEGMNLTGTRLGSIGKAVNTDLGTPTAQICYFMISKSYDNFFVNKTNGDFYALIQADRESKPQYTIHVIAVSASYCSSSAYEWNAAPNELSRTRRSLDADPVTYDPSNPSMAQIVVQIGDVNDNPPVWRSAAFFGGVTVDSPPGTVVLSFSQYVSDADAGNNSALTFGISNIRADTSQLANQLQQLGITNTVLSIAANGVLRTGDKTYFQETMSGSLIFNVSVSDSRFTSWASCTIYLLSLNQQIVVTLSDNTRGSGAVRDELMAYLSNITGWRIVANNIVTYKREDGTADDTKSDIYIHAINKTTNAIISALTVRDKIDKLWSELPVLYKTYNVLWVRLAVQPAPTDSTLEILKIALIAVACGLTVMLFFSCVSLWSCRRMYRRKLKAATAVAFGPGGNSDSLKAPGTNAHAYEGSNPIWMDLHNGAQFDNFEFESDRISHDSQLHNQLAFCIKRFDELEKSVNFYEDDTTAGGPSGPRINLDEDPNNAILSAAVEAGPNSLSDHPTLRNMPTSEI